MRNTYAGAHAAVRKARGVAREYWCDSCDSKAAQWAYVHDSPGERRDKDGRVFSSDPEDYVPMCSRCHQVYDLPDSCKNGHLWTKETIFYQVSPYTGLPVRRCRTCKREEYARRNNTPSTCPRCGDVLAQLANLRRHIKNGCRPTHHRTSGGTA